MRSLLVLLAICLMTPSALSQQNSVPPKPLNEPEKRLVLLQLYELEAARSKIVAYEDWIKREQELYEREKSVQATQLEVEKRQTELANKERDLAKDQAQFYKDQYLIVTKKRGCGFFGGLGRVFTLGAYKCNGL